MRAHLEAIGHAADVRVVEVGAERIHRGDVARLDKLEQQVRADRPSAPRAHAGNARHIGLAHEAAGYRPPSTPRRPRTETVSYGSPLSWVPSTTAFARPTKPPAHARTDVHRITVGALDREAPRGRGGDGGVLGSAGGRVATPSSTADTDAPRTVDTVALSTEATLWGVR